MADGLRGGHTRQGNNTNKGWAWAHLANYMMQLEQNGRGQGALEGAGPEEPWRVIVKLQGTWFGPQNSQVLVCKYRIRIN